MEKMTYYPSDKVSGWMKRAYAGDEEGRRLIENLEGPHALSPDGSVLLHVQRKDVTRKPDGSIRILNKAPEPGNEGYPCADIHQLTDGGASWMHIPVPISFLLEQVVFAATEDGSRLRFAFKSADGRRVEASLAQIGRAFRDLDLVMQGAKEEEIEEAFYGMGSVVVPPPIKQKQADNPRIDLERGGGLEFDESLQWFEGEAYAGERKIRVTLDTAFRHEAMKLLPALINLLEGLEETDTAARRFAVEELLELKNEVWLDEEEEEVSEEEFAARMELESLTLSVEGAATLWYMDGELFGGHTICVERDARGRFVSAEMMG